MVIRNINNTSDNKCNCGTWLKHWEQYNNLKQGVPILCPVSTCFNKAEVGAHVQLSDIKDQSWYIIPLCKSCNNKRGETLDVGFIALARANARETCGKSVSLADILNNNPYGLGRQ
jgi:hypothetical protein